MEVPALAALGPSAQAVPSVPNGRQQKRRKLWSSNDVEEEEEGGGGSCSCSSRRPVDYSNPFAIVNMIDELDDGRYGSVSKEIQELINRNARLLHSYVMRFPQLATTPVNGKSSNIFHNDSVAGQKNNFIDLDDDDDDDVVVTEVTPAPTTLVIIDSDDEEEKMDHKPINPFQQVVLTPVAQIPLDIEVRHHSGSKRAGETLRLGGKAPSLAGEARRLTREVLYLEGDVKNEHGVYVGVEEEDGPTRVEDDGLGDIWNEMSFALECSKDVAQYPSSNDRMQVGDEDCEHSFVLKDDLGYVCRICGVIERGIETIIEVQFYKAKKSMRTYISNSRDAKDRDSSDKVGVELSQEDLMVTDISAHPLHMRQMKPHQVEGFNFLCSNLVGDSPGGCIMAHAPGSGKTFMIISFMQSFLAKYPHARPLVVLPKGILPTWKREFQTWQVEDIPLFDFYSVKADSRLQQLEVLKQWVEVKSILFLGYKQFSSIVCDNGNSEAAASCQEILLKRPSVLILDEGHTPRNENTDVLQSLSKVQTPRKVVLSGTLYQNHVKEVFTILNLVRPKFLKLETSRPIVRRIWSKLDRSGSKKQSNKANEEILCELVEHTIQKDPDFKRKATIIRDLREMTSKVLHYYKGDFLDELPGLVDFTVLLNLTDWQKREVEKLKKENSKFKRTSVGSAVYLHPMLRHFSLNSAITYETMDKLMEKVDLEDGVKAKFFLNMLSLCDSAGEKLLVFSQYLTPLKFLERLAAKEKGWMNGREIFVISGESNADQREWSMERFNNSPDAKVFFGSIKACGEGISLVGASRIIILDVHLNPSVTRQAIGRAYRPGQKKKVYAYRLVAADSPEQADHSTCFRKEAIAKMWFEWNEFCGYRDFEVETVELSECDDRFLESPLLREDVRVLYKR